MLMGTQRQVLLNLYILLCTVIFASLFYFYFRELTIDQWIHIVVFASFAAFFDWRAIVLPSGEDLSLVSPLLFTVGVAHGTFPLFAVAAMMCLILIMTDVKRWTIPLFNCIQYGLSAYVGLLAYTWLGGKMGDLQLEHSSGVKI